MAKDFKPNVDDEESKSYHVVLANYDGPLDLLLDLVKRAKIRIEDIFISDITEQYLAAMDQVDELDIVRFFREWRPKRRYASRKKQRQIS